MTRTPPRIAIVVPCYNEAARLPVAEFERWIASHDTTFVFVDDGSTDATRSMLDRLRVAHPQHVEVLSYRPNAGKGEAVRRGVSTVLQGEVDYVGYWDADLATPLAAIDQFAAVLEDTPACQMVFGARVKLLGRHIHRSAARHYLGRVFATVAAQVLGLTVYDTQCGAKLFRATPGTRSLFAEPFSSRWVFDVEIIARRIQQTGSPETVASEIVEFPLHAWTDVAGSKVRPRHFLVALNDMLRIHRRYRIRRS